MKVLILSCGTGGGHNDAGKGLADAFQSAGHEVFFDKDYLAMAGQKWNDAVCKCYVEMVKYVPRCFADIYKLGRFVSSLLHKLHWKSPVYAANAKMTPYVLWLLETKKPDVVFLPHLYPAETMTKLKNMGYKLPLFVAVATDYTSIPFWEETECDYYIVPSKSTGRDFRKRGIPESKIVPFGIPAPGVFKTKYDRQKVREELGFLPENQYIVLLGGSMGAGGLKKFIKELADQLENNQFVYVICGKNKRLYKELQRKYKKNPQLVCLGYTRQVYKYLEGCDVAVTKPGGLTTTECAIVRTPVVFLNPLSGCEMANLVYFTKNGMAFAPKERKEQIQMVMKLLHSKDDREKMMENQRKTIAGNVSDEIVKWTQVKLEEKNGK